MAKRETKVGSAAGGIVLSCTCKSKFQDARYGQGKRVHTPVNKSNEKSGAPRQWRCTMCSTEHSSAKKEEIVTAPAKAKA